MKLKTKKRKGFSLVELLILLVVFSLILLAMMPMITRRHAMVEKVRHGTWICYTDSEGDYHSAIIKSGFVIKDDESSAPGKNKCEFDIPRKAKNFYIQVIGGGAGGYSIGTDPYYDSSLRYSTRYDSLSGDDADYSFNFKNNPDYTQFAYQHSYDTKLSSDEIAAVNKNAPTSEQVFNELTANYTPYTTTAAKLDNYMPIVDDKEYMSAGKTTSITYYPRDEYSSLKGFSNDENDHSLLDHYRGHKDYFDKDDGGILSFYGLVNQYTSSQNTIPADMLQSTASEDYSYVCYSPAELADMLTCIYGAEYGWTKENTVLDYVNALLEGKGYGGGKFKRFFEDRYKLVKWCVYDSFRGVYRYRDKYDNFRTVTGFAKKVDPKKDDGGAMCYSEGNGDTYGYQPIYPLKDTPTTKIYAGGQAQYFLPKLSWHYGMHRDPKSTIQQSTNYDFYDEDCTDNGTGSPKTNCPYIGIKTHTIYTDDEHVWTNTYRAKSADTVDVNWYDGNNNQVVHFRYYGGAGALNPPGFGVYNMMAGNFSYDAAFSTNFKLEDSEYNKFIELFDHAPIVNENTYKLAIRTAFPNVDQVQSNFAEKTYYIDGAISDIDKEHLADRDAHSATPEVASGYKVKLYKNWSSRGKDAIDRYEGSNNGDYGLVNPSIHKVIAYQRQALKYGYGGKAGEVQKLKLPSITNDQIENIVLGKGGAAGTYTNSSSYTLPGEGTSTIFAQGRDNELTANGGSLYGLGKLENAVQSYSQDSPLVAVNPTEWPGADDGSNDFYKRHNGYYDYDTWVGGYSAIKTYFSFVVKLVDSLKIDGKTGAGKSENVFEFFKNVGHGGQGDLLGTHCNYGYKYVTETLHNGGYPYNQASTILDILGLTPEGNTVLLNTQPCGNAYSWERITPGDSDVGYFKNAIYKVKEAEAGQDGAVIISW